MRTLEGKIAIVTGASSGIGEAVAKLFAREGAKVLLSGRREDKLETLAAEIRDSGGTTLALAGDLRDEAVSRGLVETAVGRWGGLDVAFNNAGTTGELGPLSDLPEASWRETVDTNLTSAFFCAKHQIPALEARGGGSMIFTSSFVGYTVGMGGMGAYAASFVTGTALLADGGVSIRRG